MKEDRVLMQFDAELTTQKLHIFFWIHLANHAK
jgi:hypothetical protein